MARRYHVDPLPSPGPARLQGDVAWHLAQVMRARPGEEIVLFDGRGRECRARLVAVHRGGIELQAEPAVAGGREPEHRLEAAFALPKGTRADWLFEHGTEVGIRVFRPLWTERSRSSDRVERWRRIVAAAAGQCDRAFVPDVREPIPFAELWQQDLPAQKFLAARDAPPLPRATAGVLVLVGPEGGFSAAEREQAHAAGCIPASVSALTLRTETAVVAAAIRML
jgi:16S rRNA (uracil1498-N3)-methyltransferase